MVENSIDEKWKTKFDCQTYKMCPRLENQLAREKRKIQMKKYI